MNPLTFESLALQPSPVITFSYIMQVLFSLLVMVALIYVTAKFVLPKLKIVGAPGKFIQVVDRSFLEPGVSAYILKVGKLAWLVVVSSKQIERIDRVELE